MLRQRGNSTERVNVGIERRLVEGFSENVGVVRRGWHVKHANLSKSYELAHFEVATLDVPRALTRLHVAGELDSALIVDVKGSRLEVVAELA